MKHKNLLKLSLLFVSLTLWHSQSAAYQYWVCLDRDLKWDSPNVGIGASHVSFASSSWMNSLSTSVSRWNQTPSNFNYVLSTDTNGVGRGNGQNEVWFSNDPDALQGAPAIAYSWWQCIDYWIFGKTVKMTEIDVIFDVNEAYTPFMTNKSALWEYGGGSRPFQTTALHELGHGLGLAHVNYNYNVLGTDWTHIHVNGANARSYAGEDATRGAVHLYGTEIKQDVAASQWKYGSASGEYSSHVRTVLRNEAGGLISSTVVGGEPVYNVTQGQRVRMEFTYENNGSNTQGVNVGVFISTNDLITTLDSKIGNIGLTLAPDVVFTRQDLITIPASIPRNSNRWLGVVVDDNNSVSEFVESNNATYVRIKIL